MVEVFEKLLSPFIQFFTNLIDLIVNIPYLLLSILRLLLNFGEYMLSFSSNFINAINFLVIGYDTVYSILAYMPSPIVTLVVLGIGVSSIRLVLDFL